MKRERVMRVVIIRGGITSDNQIVDNHHVSCVKMILAGCTESEISSLGQKELFDRLAENFIKANTKNDIKEFIAHNISLKIADLIIGK